MSSHKNVTDIHMIIDRKNQTDKQLRANDKK